MAWLGAIYVLIFLALVFGTPAFIYYKWGRQWERRRRDQHIETYMRLGLRDAEAQQQAAQKIYDELYGG